MTTSGTTAFDMDFTRSLKRRGNVLDERCVLVTTYAQHVGL